MVGPYPLPTAVSRRSPGGDEQVLCAVLPSSVGQAATRCASRQQPPSAPMMRGPQNTARLTHRRREALGFGLAAALLVVLFVVAFSSGRFPVSFGDLLRLLSSKISGSASALS